MSYEPTRLGNERVGGVRDERSPDGWYGAVRAAAVAAFTDLEVCGGSGSQPGSCAGAPRCGIQKSAQRLEQPVLGIDWHERIGFGHRVGKVGAVARGQAACHHDPAARTLCTPTGVEVEEAGDRLLYSGFDECARVEDHDIGVGQVVGQQEARCLDGCGHPVGVDLVLGASESHERYGRCRGYHAPSGSSRTGGVCHNPVL